MIYTVINFLFFYSIFIGLYIFKKIRLNLLFIFFFLLLSVFFFNGFLFHPGYMPDQESFVLLVSKVRGLNFYFLDDYFLNVSDRTFLSAGFMALVPAPFIYDYLDVSLQQKFLYLCTILYLYNKKALNHYSLAILLFLPSIVLYTGVALKESFLFLLVSFGFYFSLKRKYIFSLIAYTILALVKPLIFILGFGFNLFYLLIFEYKMLMYVRILFLIIIFSILLFFIIQNIELINSEFIERRIVESIYDQRIDQPTELNLLNFLSILNLIMVSFMNFLFNPNIFSAINLFQFIQSIENIFFLILLIFNFFYCYRINKAKSFFWILYFLAGMIIIGGTVFNAGTLSRWKTEIIMYYIFYINLSCLKLKNQE